ncbi:hypothetical protein PanWU01x14_168690 [Parasponia andersonii]|uniref:Uncharacterized protein n=1 Tax=Parasponia andersonii TaxID=3476 RepID=A0A2P5CAL6_PARAD|nr:hypothetical protein PanWU01x14_168690 [Parasponia andersonii]
MLFLGSLSMNETRRLCSTASMISFLIAIYSVRKWEKEPTIFLEREA